MGWDIMACGLHHTLPVKEPLKVAEIISKYHKKNVEIVAFHKYVHIKKTNTLKQCEGTFKVLNRVGNFDSNEVVWMKMIDYEIKKILKDCHGNIDSLNISEEVDLYWLRDDVEYVNKRAIYESGVEIYKENILFNEIIDVFPGRWFTYADIFVYPFERYQGELIEDFKKFRVYLYQQCQYFGCTEVMIFADQGPTQGLFDKAHLKSDTLKKYAHSDRWLREDERILKRNMGIEPKSGREPIIIDMVKFLQEGVPSSKEPDIIFDDFRDFKSHSNIQDNSRCIFQLQCADCKNAHEGCPGLA